MKSKFGSVFWIHLIFILVSLSSPFFLSWRIILLFIILYYIQLIIFGNCILTIKQFKSKKQEETVYGFILEKLGFKVNKKFVAKIVDYVLPWIILGLAIVLQSKPL